MLLIIKMNVSNVMKKAIKLPVVMLKVLNEWLEQENPLLFGLLWLRSFQLVDRIDLEIILINQKLTNRKL